jgi:DNA-binding transcriptional regulator YhcF (GntR family)
MAVGQPRADPGKFDFRLDRGAEVPVGVQLAWAIRARIEDGRLGPGQRLPGSREVAESLRVNANTVRAVYGRLELDGLIESRHGSGTFVTASPANRPAASTIAIAAAEQARRAGIEPRDVAASLYVGDGGDRTRGAASAGEISGTRGGAAEVSGTRGDAGPGPVGDATKRRSALRAQIAALQQAIDEIETEHVGVIPRRQRGQASESARPRLLDVGELEQVRLALLHRLATLQAAIEQLASNADGSPRSRTQRPATAAAPGGQASSGGASEGEKTTSEAGASKGGKPRRAAPRRNPTLPSTAGA